MGMGIGDKLSPEPMMSPFPDANIIRHQWVIHTPWSHDFNAG